MRLRLLGLLFIGVLCLGFTSNVLAQQTDDWFLAWGFEGQLITYTPDGESTVLIPEGVSNDSFRAWRMDDDSVLALVELNDIDETQVLYHVTQTSATPITVAAEAADWMLDSYRLELVANSATHALLVAGGNLPAGKALLVNLVDNSANLLAEQVMFMPVKAAAFSEDGLYLRYLRGEQDKDETWTLRELKLETGEERVFYTVEGNAFPIMNTDLHGDVWLYFYDNVSYVISRSGDVEATEYDAPEDRIIQRFIGDYRVSWPILCETDCVMEWQRMPDGEMLTFQLPDLSGGDIPNPVAPVGDDQLLIIPDSESLWLVSEDEPVYLGAWSPEKVVTAPNRIVSPDGRWLLVLNDAETADEYRVADLQSGETVVEGDPEREFHILQVFYGDAGFIVSEDALYFQYYRTSDGKVFDLGEPGGVYWNVLADGTLLFNHYRDEDMARGIYRYDPDTQDYTLLLENALSLWVEDPTP
jgi:hypothetical protein